MSKQSAISDARFAFRELLASVEGMDDAAMSTTFFGEWGVKQILAHIAGWQRLNAEMMERMGRGEHPVPDGEDYGDDDAWNARFAAEASAGSGPEAVPAIRESFRRFITAAQALPEERFEGGRFAAQVLAGTGVAHIEKHLPAIVVYRSALEAR